MCIGNTGSWPLVAEQEQLKDIEEVLVVSDLPGVSLDKFNVKKKLIVIYKNIFLSQRKCAKSPPVTQERKSGFGAPRMSVHQMGIQIQPSSSAFQETMEVGWVIRFVWEFCCSCWPNNALK